jgi:hypothetical protein
MPSLSKLRNDPYRDTITPLLPTASLAFPGERGLLDLSFKLDNSLSANQVVLIRRTGVRPENRK